MFTKEDIREIAVQIENNAEQLYRKAAQMSTDPEISQALLWMADQERDHAQLFKSMAPFPAPSSQNRQVFEMGRELLLAGLQDQTFSLDSVQVATITAVQELLERSIEFENDTILFYEMLREFTDDTKVTARLDAIILEERKHIDTIRDFMGGKNSDRITSI